MKKKLVALLLVVVMILSFTACGEKDNPDGGSSTNTGSQTSGGDNSTADPIADAEAKGEMTNGKFNETR